MSLTGDRAAIAAALTTATGVVGYAYRPTTPKPGDAWPLLGGLDHEARSGQFVATWRVVVSLPQDERQASEWFDDHYESIVDALLPVGYVDRVEPGLIATDAGDQQSMVITMRSEG